MGVMETLGFAAILFLSSAPHTESLSIKRHAPKSSDADLTAALAVLQRHRRQTSDVDFLKSYLLENQDKIPPSFLDALNDNYGLLEKNQGKLPPSFLDALNDNYGLNLENYYSKKPESDNIVDRRMFLDAYGRNNYKDIGLFSPYESDKRNVKRSRTIPTKAELAEIFGDINRASERTHKRQISSKPSEYSVHESNFQKSKQNVAPSETKEMSDKGNDGEKNNKDSDMREPTPVSTDELKSVFGDDTENRQSTLSPSKAPSQTTAKESKEERSVPTEGERFEDLASIKAEKKKRVEKRDYDSEMELSQSVLDLTRTVAALRDEVARLKIAEALEDKENDLLASALKQATLGQLQGTEGSLKKEFLDIQNAIRVEQELQSIRGPENSDDSDETSEEEEGEEEIPLGEKRQTIPEEITPNESVDPGQWYENPVTDDRDEMDEEENEKAIGELVSSLSPSERQQLAQEYLGNSAYDEPSNENNCPGVNYLTSQCSVAKMAGLRIDEDAKNLCNRHELCYTCGGTLSFSQTTCDAGFRGDVIEMCGKDTECIENGAKFLWFLKSEHTYNYGYLDKCDSGCVSDFIKGL